MEKKHTGSNCRWVISVGIISGALIHGVRMWAQTTENILMPATPLEWSKAIHEYRMRAEMMN